MGIILTFSFPDNLLLPKGFELFVGGRKIF